MSTMYNLKKYKMYHTVHMGLWVAFFPLIYWWPHDFDVRKKGHEFCVSQLHHPDRSLRSPLKEGLYCDLCLQKFQSMALGCFWGTHTHTHTQSGIFWSPQVYMHSRKAPIHIKIDRRSGRHSLSFRSRACSLTMTPNQAPTLTRFPSPNSIIGWVPNLFYMSLWGPL